MCMILKLLRSKLKVYIYIFFKIAKIINIINDDWELYNKTQKISEAMHLRAVIGSKFTLFYICNTVKLL